MEPHGDQRPFAVIPVGDSPESRLFIELSSYGSDLAEARDALDLATRGAEEGSALAYAPPYLVRLAAVAYCRTIMRSNVRGLLTDHVDIPDEFVGVHDMVKSYRNATIAHSQSELAVTYAVGVLDPGSLRVLDVAGPTVVVPLPTSVVQEFKALVDVMDSHLGEVIEPVRAGLMKSLAGMDQSQLEDAIGPQVQEKWAHEFDPKTKRAKYPTGHTVYWDVTVGDPSKE